MSGQLIQVLLGLVVAVGVSLFSVPILRKVAYLSDLYDKPDNERKLHDRYVPTLGGVGIFLAFFVGFSISGFAEQIQGYPYLAAALITLLFTGLKDDIVDLSPKTKLLVELAVAALLIFGCDFYISNFYGVFGIESIPYWASVLITTFTMIVVVNAYNLIDGIDGLAGGVGAIAAAFFGIGFYVSGEYAFAVLALTLFVSLVSYLKFNFHPAKIFMGDTGSLVIGFLLATLAINFIGLNESSEYVSRFGYSSSILPIAILALPLYDTITVFYKRIRKGKSPFSPGQDHVHHAMINAGLGHKSTSILLYFCSVFIILIAISLRDVEVNISLSIIVATMFLFLPTNGLKRKFIKKMGIDLDLNSRKSGLVGNQEKTKKNILDNVDVSSRSKTQEDIKV